MSTAYLRDVALADSFVVLEELPVENEFVLNVKRYALLVQNPVPQSLNRILEVHVNLDFLPTHGFDDHLETNEEKRRVQLS